jgi:hypothetical protein
VAFEDRAVFIRIKSDVRFEAGGPLINVAFNLEMRKA